MNRCRRFSLDRHFYCYVGDFYKTCEYYEEIDGGIGHNEPCKFLRLSYDGESKFGTISRVSMCDNPEAHAALALEEV